MLSNNESTIENKLSYKQISLIVHPDVVEKLKSKRNEHGKLTTMDLFGISYNTWRKIQSGQPIRRSVVERLLSRVEIQAAGQ